MRVHNLAIAVDKPLRLHTDVTHDEREPPCVHKAPNHARADARRRRARSKLRASGRQPGSRMRRPSRVALIFRPVCINDSHNVYYGTAKLRRVPVVPFDAAAGGSKSFDAHAVVSRLDVGRQAPAQRLVVEVDVQIGQHGAAWAASSRSPPALRRGSNAKDAARSASASTTQTSSPSSQRRLACGTPLRSGV